MSEYIEKFEEWAIKQGFDLEPINRAISIFSELDHPDSSQYVMNVLYDAYIQPVQITGPSEPWMNGATTGSSDPAFNP